MNEAWDIAVKAHKGQRDKAGIPYIFHPIAVASTFVDERLRIVALLHDVLEDTDITEEYLRERFDTEIVGAVVALTRKENESYQDFILRLSDNKMAREVKKADIKHNLSKAEVYHPENPIRQRQHEKRVKRYQDALAFLNKSF